MKISIFGMGYVGAVLTGCFARDGHEVLGVDTESTKVDMINRGQSPIIEKDIEPMIADGVRTGRIRATSDAQQAVLQTELSMICVGTPSKPSGELDLSFVARVSENIGAALRAKEAYHVVVVRSTMLPGSVEGVVIPALERASGKKFGQGFGVAINPEFLRESTAVYDFYNPPKTVIGAQSARDADLVASLYDKLPAPLLKTPIKVAEMVKYADNIFHALKITFGNEIGAFCKEHGVDGHAVMDIFCQDRKLNLSPVYLKPGFAFGGSCLPKDLRALSWAARARSLELPMLAAIGPSNEQQIRKAIQIITDKGCRRIGVLGFAFKGGTDDLRESPVVTLIETLLGKGYELKLYDNYVSLARLVGANRKYIEHRIPHISRLMVDSLDELVSHAEVILLGNVNEEYYPAFAQFRPEQQLVDLTPHQRWPATPARYERISG